ncbi:hypothetical protein [Natrinema pallidum]|uniref:Uncharacterized protein n=1 Tax=Natrinema pallidum TaxID=69527 RepID=A0A4P9TFX5_9EURY|nr:hypothetical protein [Natrinema pallidum]QCW03629.1 hypothetical protein FGF80_10420 [Natrinema pallidum]
MDEVTADVEQKGVLEGRLYMKEHDIGEKLAELNDELEDKLEDVALTDDQRQKLESGIDTGDWVNLGTPIASYLVGSLLTPLAGLVTGLGLVSLKNWFGNLDGDIQERMQKLTKQLEDQGYLTSEGESTGDLDMDSEYEQ